MCIVFYFKTKSNELLIFSNRDEYLSRESSFIEIKNRIIGGRDKREHQEGLWLGISLDGKFGFITNYIQSDLSGLSNQSSQSNQSLQISSKDKITRGVLIRDYLQGDKPPQEYLKSLNLSKFNGFTLVVGTLNSTFLISNCKSPPVFEEMKVNEVYVISNGKFDEGDWEKVRRGKELFKNLLDERSDKQSLDTSPDLFQNCFKILHDHNDNSQNPSDSIFVKPYEREGKLYGTKTMTVLVVKEGLGEMRELDLQSGRMNSLSFQLES